MGALVSVGDNASPADASEHRAHHRRAWWIINGSANVLGSELFVDLEPLVDELNEGVLPVLTLFIFVVSVESERHAFLGCLTALLEPPFRVPPRGAVADWRLPDSDEPGLLQPSEVFLRHAVRRRELHELVDRDELQSSQPDRALSVPQRLRRCLRGEKLQGLAQRPDQCLKRLLRRRRVIEPLDDLVPGAHCVPPISVTSHGWSRAPMSLTSLSGGGMVKRVASGKCSRPRRMNASPGSSRSGTKTNRFPRSGQTRSSLSHCDRAVPCGKLVGTVPHGPSWS